MHLVHKSSAASCNDSKHFSRYYRFQGRVLIPGRFQAKAENMCGDRAGARKAGPAAATARPMFCDVQNGKNQSSTKELTC
jgi:hypothetical protein